MEIKGVKKEISQLIKEAKQNGALTYFPGIPCSKGHISERYVSNKSCVVCALRYQEEHPEKWLCKTNPKLNPEKWLCKTNPKLNYDRVSENRAKTREKYGVTFVSETWQCKTCGGNERYSTSRGCYNCKK